MLEELKKKVYEANMELPKYEIGRASCRERVFRAV